MSPHPQTALALHHAIVHGERKAVDILDETFRQIEATDGTLGCYLSLTKDIAYDTARTVDAMVAEGKPLPLMAGVPIALKDNMNIIGTPTTCASKILEGYISPYHCTAYEKVAAHLMPVVGKTNMDEFAMGSSTENSALQLTRNPWDTERVPGGSSGGSAATVAAGHVTISLGSDTGGSVRQPAALCGLTGIKPTYGLVSRYGLVAYASSLDQISPFAKNTKDLAATLQVIAGHDPKDSTSLKNPGDLDYLSAIEHLPSGLRVGIISELDGEGMQPEVAEAFQKSIEVFKDLGATVERISIPAIGYAVNAYYILAPAEASSNLARFDGVRYGRRVEDTNTDIFKMYRKTRAQGFGAEVKRRIMLGTFALSAGYYDAYYGKAQKTRLLLKQEFDRAFEQVDVLICPTSPSTAFKIGEKVNDPISMYLSDIATIPVNLAGVPGMNIPAGFDQQGLPIGLQLIGPQLSEKHLFQVAQAFESKTGLANLQPKSIATAV